MSKKILLLGCAHVGKVCLSSTEVLEVLSNENERKSREDNVMRIENFYKDLEVIHQPFIPNPKRRKNRQRKRRNHYE